jgi:hypothetical protein
LDIIYIDQLMYAFILCGPCVSSEITQVVPISSLDTDHDLYLRVVIHLDTAQTPPSPAYELGPQLCSVPKEPLMICYLNALKHS